MPPKAEPNPGPAPPSSERQPTVTDPDSLEPDRSPSQDNEETDLVVPTGYDRPNP